MKNSEILGNLGNMNNLVKKASEEKEKFPTKFSYALTRNMLLMQKELEPFEKEREKLLEEYNVKDKDGCPKYKTTQKIEIDSKFTEIWNKKISELLNIDIPFEPHKVGIEDFPESIEPVVLLALNFMIAE